MKKKIWLSALFLVLVIGLYAQQNPVITTFILVRHAEKMSSEESQKLMTGADDPELKPEGQERAKRLAAMLKNTTINAVYSTRYKRTKNTVAPLAQEKGLEVQVYESMKANDLDELIKKHSGQTVLVGGHSNTIPQIANTLIGKEEFKNFADADYGNLIIISVTQRGSAKVTWLTY